MENPLIQPILATLEEHTKGISEYDLLRLLEQKTDIFTELGDNPRLVLFRKHFLIMNALYQLQLRLWQEDQVKLYISPLNISLYQDKATLSLSSSVEINDAYEAKLAAYYLDWEEYDNTNAEDVELLLKGFYKKFHNHSDTKMALETLGVEENSSKSDIKLAYRKRIHNAHPDKGGDAKTFIKLRRAYEYLISRVAS